VTAEARLSSKGQVVIPKEMREKLGLKVGDKLRFEITPEKVLTISSTAKAARRCLRSSWEQNYSGFLEGGRAAR